MTQNLFKNCIDEICLKPPKKIYSTNETNFHHIDDSWSLDILD